jgi:hypothetical protein
MEPCLPRLATQRRFDAILRHIKPDKLPFYFPTIACSVASELLGRAVDSGADSLHFKEERSWLDGPEAHDEWVARYHENAIALNRLLRADIGRETWRCSDKPTKLLDENTLLFGEQDGPHLIKQFLPEQQSYGVVEDTLSPNDPEDLVKALQAEMQRDARVTESELDATYRSQLRFQELAAPYFPTIVNGLSIGIPMSSTAWLEATVMEPDFLCEYFTWKAELAVQHIPWLRKKGVRFINAGMDLASSSGPVLSPATFRRILGRPLKQVADECRKRGMVYCYRTDGNIWALMDEIFSGTGIQAYGEVDRQASMTVREVRAKYPDLLLLGNVSSTTLGNGTEAEVRQETKASLQESGGRNYIPGPSNAIVHGTPAKNIWAMREEIERYNP